MTEQYIGWALVVGIALGAAVVWFVLGRLPRRSDDIGLEERVEEARWISRTIESRGGIAPPALVEEVLDLHARYLEGPPLEVRPAPPPILVTDRASPEPPPAPAGAGWGSNSLEEHPPDEQPVGTEPVEQSPPALPTFEEPRPIGEPELPDEESELADEDRRSV